MATCIFCGKSNKKVCDSCLKRIKNGDMAFAFPLKQSDITTITNACKPKPEKSVTAAKPATSRIVDSVFHIEDGVLVKYTGKRKNVIIPFGVTCIGEKAFYGRTSLESIKLSSDVTSIGKNAFNKCDSLTVVTFAENSKCKSIGDGAFSFCRSVKDITIPSSVTSIGKGAFSNCSGLVSITIPGSMKSIGDEVFSECYVLKNITIPDSVTSIGDGAFSFCRSLKDITIPSSVTSIGSGAFDSCKNLVIHASAGSYAERYARDNHIKFVWE